MSAEGASLDYFCHGQNGPKMGSSLRRENAEHIQVKLPVIFPRVHIARNVRRCNRNPFYFVSMSREDCPQTLLGIQRH
jgi:hypothetical protein